jgi:type II secretory pathway component PulJ
MRGQPMRNTQRRESGSTLVELSVAMLIFSVLLVACATLYLGSLRSASATQGRLDEINDGRIAISAMGRSLRTAILPSQLYDTASTETAAFIEATPVSIRFYANIDNPGNSVGPSKVTYAIVDGELRETVQQPNPPTATSKAFIYCTPGPTCPTRNKVLARGVVSSGAPIFSYYDQLGTRLTGDSLTAAQLEIVDSVDVAVTVQKPRVAGGGSTYALRIALPNHDAVVRAENED